jgi:hypothetical protein
MRYTPIKRTLTRRSTAEAKVRADLRRQRHRVAIAGRDAPPIASSSGAGTAYHLQSKDSRLLADVDLIRGDPVLRLLFGIERPEPVRFFPQFLHSRKELATNFTESLIVGS